MAEKFFSELGNKLLVTKNFPFTELVTFQTGHNEEIVTAQQQPQPQQNTKPQPQQNTN